MSDLTSELLSADFPFSLPLSDFSLDPLLVPSQEVPLLDSTSSDTDSISSPLSPSVPHTPLVAPILPLNVSQTNPHRTPKRKGPSRNSRTNSIPVAPQVMHGLLKEKQEKDAKLKRKAELARNSRRKKKERLEELEKQVSALQAELARAREENKILSARTVVLESKGKHPTESDKSTERAIDDLLALARTNPPHPDKSLEQPLSEVSLAHKRQIQTMECSMNSLEQAIMPSMSLQFLEWLISAERDQFYEDKDGLFLSLFRDQLGASQQQIELLLTLRREMQKDDSKKDQMFFESFQLFKSSFSARGILKQKEIFDRLRSIFSPSQLTSYFHYVKQYGHVLIKVHV